MIVGIIEQVDDKDSKVGERCILVLSLKSLDNMGQ